MPRPAVITSGDFRQHLGIPSANNITFSSKTPYFRRTFNGHPFPWTAPRCRCLWGKSLQNGNRVGEGLFATTFGAIRKRWDGVEEVLVLFTVLVEFQDLSLPMPKNGSI
ncbi:hypothetical protein GPALN_007414 [Globodera pallida]|nr:hypothetical protein GPALN_007414 [Globodera pallida]